MGKSTKAERIETRDGVGYLHGGKIYTEKEYDSILTGQGVDGNSAFAGGGKKSSVSKKNVAPAGEELMRGVDTKSMTTGPKQTPAPTGEISLDQKLESFKDKNPQFYNDMKAGKTEGWNEIIKNEVPYGNTGMPNSTDVMKEIVSQISAGSGVLKTLSGTSQSKPGLPGGNLGVLTVDKETGNDIITVPKQSAGETNANSYIGTQKSPIGSQPTTTTPTTSTGKTQKYMGKEAPVIESDTFSNAMRKFASSNQDPTGKVFYWNGKAYKYQIAQPGQKKPTEQIHEEITNKFVANKSNVGPKKEYIEEKLTNKFVPSTSGTQNTKPFTLTNSLGVQMEYEIPDLPTTGTQQSDYIRDTELAKKVQTEKANKKPKSKSLISMSKQPQQSPNI